MVDLVGQRRLHLVGVAGAGMSALAKLFHQMDYQVSGSDLRPGNELAALADLGIEVWPGHDRQRMAGVDLVVASSAVPEDDPEMRAAAAAGIPIWYRPQLLAALTSLVPTIGATGTHGKTTSTAMLVTSLRGMGADPSFVVGGDLVELATNAHRGTDDLLVLEVDEAFGTFEQVRLQGLMVTNVEPDHLDYFGTAERMESTFVEVVGKVEGPVVVGNDDEGGRRVAERTNSPTFGTSPDATFRIADLEEHAGGVRFRLSGPGLVLPVVVARPGAHNARNAAGVLALLLLRGHDPSAAVEALSRFRGVRRRFELRGQVSGVVLIDDYAHHPTEVAAIIAAARSGGHRRILAVFQPHLYSRTQLLHQRFGQALAAADRVVVTDIYAAREAPIPGVTGRLVAEAAEAAGALVDYLPHRRQLAGFLASIVEPGDLVLTMGAGDITLVPTELAQLIASGDRPG